jgi:flagellar basal-body rod modification protein FlgD
MINSLNSLPSTNSSSGTSSSGGTLSSSSAGGMTENDFLKLLVAQMQNQDPTNPMDSTQYASQLAQFSSLEQLQNLNTSMTQSLNANYALSQSITNSLASNLIGKYVTLGSTIQNNGQGSAEIGYNLPANAKSAEIDIYDSNNNLVKTISSVSLNQGEHKLSWNFTDNNGNSLPSGSYTIKMQATSLTGLSLSANAYAAGDVSAIKFGSSGTTLVVDNAEYQLSDVSEILTSDPNE